jgi:hypothetical protein
MMFATSALIVSAILAFLASPVFAVQVDSQLNVAFIGDSGDGPNFEKVLQLIADEDVDLILHQGDFSYSRGPTRNWLERIDDHVKDVPYLGSNGNHDVWSLYYSGFFAGQIAALKKKGAIVTGDPKSGNYAVFYRGLKMVFLDDSPEALQLNGQAVAPSQYIADEFAAGDHDWRICSWHKNQRAMQVGSKGDDMGWPVYEACRRHGAIIATGHEHSYQRTRTLTNMELQTIDASCRDDEDTPDFDVCISSGKTFAFVSGLGGTGIRDQDRCLPSTFPYGCDEVWAKIYTSTQDAEFGALFITFNVDGDPNKAQGYFKNTSGQVVDRFRITKD